MQRSRSPYSNNTILSVEPSFTVTYSTLHREITTTAGSQTTKQYLSSEETFFDHVSGIMSQYNSIPHKVIGDEDLCIPSMSFRGGLVGYFGYEMKRESMAGYHVPDEQKCSCPLHNEGKQSAKNCCRCNEVPDAAFHFVDRFFTFDHKERCINICCLVRYGDEGIVGVAEDDARMWIRTNEQLLVSVAEKLRRKKLEKDFISLSPASSRGSTPDVMPILKQEVFTPDTTHDKYIESIRNCVQQIREGESYEICLTTQFRHQLDKGIARSACDTQLTKLYTRHLRMNNPAPFSAVLSFPSCQMSLMSSSPERFLKVDSNGVVEMKPIKGTAKRCLECVCDEHEGVECDMDEECNSRIVEEDERRMQNLWSDVKERAENLMVSDSVIIVDLIRNDLAQFCKPTTVSVPKLMHVETYEKVHHLVSTVCAQLRPDIDSVRAVQNSFPPGSMTGAPKLRSVQILDNVEHHIPRGIYSGCLGYFSIGDASSSTGKTTAQFSVVIRTAVASTKPSHVELTIGGGGAITFLSDPENEWHEVLLKTKSVAPSVKEFLDNAPVTFM
ncbi:hypothetical protein INT43_005895 [Umbelopsis isabellina]|uniref:Aminodeoxychorismate synthase n=1 Tax=Mortierella isabellina TaxID=91625 RepID=A0A8H7UCG8_MORIS|nr:hypothetical protein INT43_005895 [Umbelopsis isabellina]